MEKYDVFISYNRNNVHLATQIIEELKDEGLKCFLDKENLDENFADTIQSAIFDSKYFIFIYGDDSDNSIYQRQELDLALALNKKVISILLKISKVGIIPSILYQKTDCIFYGKYDCQSSDVIIKEIKQKIADDRNRHIINPCPTTENKMNGNYKTKNIPVTIFFLIILSLTAYFILTNISLPSPDISSPYEYEDFQREIKELDNIDYEELQRQFEEYEKQMDKAGSFEKKIGSTEKLVDALDSIKNEMEKNVEHSASIEDELFSINDFDIDRTTESNGENIESVEQENIWNNEFIILSLGITLSLGIISGIIILKLTQKIARNKNIKISSDVDASIFIDNVHKANIKAGEMYLTHLNKGEYIIDIKSNDDKAENNRIIKKVDDNDTHVVVSNFLSKREIQFKCFIAGSIGLSAERDALRSVMAEMYNQWEAERIRICSYTFEDFNKEVVVGGQQILYDKFIEEKADWVVFIISNGIGEKTLNEYNIAMNSFERQGHPKILFLANTNATNDMAVWDIKERIIATSQYWNTYNNIEQMKSIFYRCINWDVTLLSRTRK